jgi:putative FmdB family regulatory protein
MRHRIKISKNRGIQVDFSNSPPTGQRGRIKEEATMPQYVFLCQDCHKEFSATLHIADLEKGGTVCPHCGGQRVIQQVAEFSAVTSKKS